LWGGPPGPRPTARSALRPRALHPLRRAPRVWEHIEACTRAVAQVPRPSITPPPSPLERTARSAGDCVSVYSLPTIRRPKMETSGCTPRQQQAALRPW
jgi:hypothetical protein